jgi:O-antigen/teichoic acid export membrane protein
VRQNTHSDPRGSNGPTNQAFRLRAVHDWLGKGFWALADQGLFAASNFALNVLLARWLSPQEYGAFAVGFAVFLLVQIGHTTLLIDPMLFFGPGQYRTKFKAYLETLLSEHWRLSVLLSTVLLATALSLWLASLTAVGLVVLVLVPTGPFILLQWLLRRACYVRLEPRLAATAGAAYASMILGGAVLLFRSNLLSVESAFALMGVASLIAALWLAYRLDLRLAVSPVSDLTRNVRKEHWRYGRWLTGAALLRWTSVNLYFLLLPIWGGLEAAGTFRALFNLLLPALHVNFAMGPILVPAFVSAVSREGFQHRVRVSSVGLVSGGIFYWLLLALFHKPIVAWLYAGRYDASSSILLWLGAVSALMSLVTVAAAALRAAERPDAVFRADAVFGVFALLVGLLLIPTLGAEGASLGLVLSYVVAAAVMTWQLRLRETKKTSIRRPTTIPR